MSDTEDFEKRSKRAFDESVAGLNGNIRSRLTQARHAALAQMPAARERDSRRFWIPAAGFGAAALIAAVAIVPGISTERALPETFAAADDMALLLNNDDLEMIEDLEFYAWLDGDSQALPESTSTTDGDDAHT